jgi:hypothetical protein
MKNPRKHAPMAVVAATVVAEIGAPGASAHLTTCSRDRVNRPR